MKSKHGTSVQWDDGAIKAFSLRFEVRKLFVQMTECVVFMACVVWQYVNIVLRVCMCMYVGLYRECARKTNTAATQPRHLLSEEPLFWLLVSVWLEYSGGL